MRRDIPDADVVGIEVEYAVDGNAGELFDNRLIAHVDLPLVAQDEGRIVTTQEALNELLAASSPPAFCVVQDPGGEYVLAVAGAQGLLRRLSLAGELPDLPAVSTAIGEWLTSDEATAARMTIALAARGRRLPIAIRKVVGVNAPEDASTFGDARLLLTQVDLEGFSATVLVLPAPGVPSDPEFCEATAGTTNPVEIALRWWKKCDEE